MNSNRKTRTGRVVSTKMQKTVIVEVERLVRHPVYKKVLRRTKNYKVHDEKNACHLGDIVKIEETRPLSKDKRWRVLEILRTGNVAEVSPADIGQIQTEVELSDSD